MNKKALEMATGTIIAIVLGLIVLVILVIFIQSQISKSGTKLGTLESEADYAPDKCQSMIKGTFCSNSCDTKKYEAKSASPTGQPYKDCLEKKFNYCCVPLSS